MYRFNLLSWSDVAPASAIIVAADLLIECDVYLLGSGSSKYTAIFCGMPLSVFKPTGCVADALIGNLAVPGKIRVKYFSAGFICSSKRLKKYNKIISGRELLELNVTPM